MIKWHSRHIRQLLTREHFWTDFQATEIHYTQLGPREHSVAKGLPHLKTRRCLGWKKLRVAFQRKPTLGLVFHPWLEYTLPRVYLQTLVLLRFWDRHQALNILACYVLLFPTCEKKAFSSEIWFLHTREHTWCDVQATEIPAHNRAKGTFGSWGL